MRNHNVDGVRIPFTAEEETAADIVDAAHLADKPSRDAQQSIATLEASISNRRMREAALGTDGGWLAATDAEIATLRGQL